MKSLLSHIRSLRVSPTGARDLSQILSPIRLGIWFLFFNLTVILAFALAYQLVREASIRPNSEEAIVLTSAGLGQTFAAVLFCAIGVFLTIFVPIRIFGFLIGPRTHRYFDQIVISGISPARYMAGKVMLQNLFFLIILAASVPYLALCMSLGGVSLPYILAAVYSLWLYTNILCLVTMTVSVITYEFVAVPAIIFLGIMAFWLGAFPIPHPLNLAPSQLLISPLFENLLPMISSEIDGFGFVETLGYLGANLMMYTLTAVIVCVCLAVFLMIGPAFSISGPMKMFGAVIMPGDSKRKLMFRNRSGLRRRAEVAFFYENRSPRLQSLDPFLRWGFKEVIFLGLLMPALIYAHLFASNFSQYEFHVLLVALGIIMAIVNSFLFNRDRGSVNLRYPGMSAARMDLICSIGNLAIIFILVFLGAGLRDLFFGEIQHSYSFSIHDRTLGLMYSGIVIVSGGLAFYAIAQFLATKSWSNSRAQVFAGLVFFALIILPILGNIFLIRDRWLLSEFEIKLISHIMMISPIVQIAEQFGESIIPRFIDVTIWPCLIVHAGLAILFLWLAHRARRKSARIESAYSTQFAPNTNMLPNPEPSS